MIDGLSQNIAEEWKPGGHSKDARYVSQQPIDAGWISTPEYDYAKGTYDGEFTDPPDKNSIFFYPRKSKGKIATQTREVFFLKPDIYVIRDTAVPNDDQPHTAQARWHLASVKTAFDEATGAVVTQDPGRQISPSSRCCAMAWRSGRPPPRRSRKSSAGMCARIRRPPHPCHHNPANPPGHGAAGVPHPAPAHQARGGEPGAKHFRDCAL